MRANPLENTAEWEAILESLCRLQKIVPGTIVVGDLAAAIHAGHRISVDHDHVLPDLQQRFDSILLDLESVSGWELARKIRPVIILGSLDGIETGIRQMKRAAPLETETYQFHGVGIRIPTLAEALRIKSYPDCAGKPRPSAPDA